MWDLFVLPALGFIELAFLAVFFIALCFATAFDRDYNYDAPKWWIFLVGIVVTTVWFWKDWTFGGIIGTVTSWKFWEPAVIYIVLGLVYSLVEFYFAVRRAARKYAASWKSYNGKVKDFVSDYARYKNPLIGIEIVDEKPSPKVNKDELAACLGAWTFFWPAYALSLVLGDLFIEIFKTIANGLVKISGRFVRMAFKDVFQ